MSWIDRWALNVNLLTAFVCAYDSILFAATPMIISSGLTQDVASSSTAHTVVGIDKKHSDAVVNFILRMTCQVWSRMTARMQLKHNLNCVFCAWKRLKKPLLNVALFASFSFNEVLLQIRFNAPLFSNTN